MGPISSLACFSAIHLITPKRWCPPADAWRDGAAVRVRRSVTSRKVMASITYEVTAVFN
jgi:hypothetical protein